MELESATLTAHRGIYTTWGVYTVLGNPLLPMGFAEFNLFLISNIYHHPTYSMNMHMRVSQEHTHTHTHRNRDRDKETEILVDDIEPTKTSTWCLR